MDNILEDKARKTSEKKKPWQVFLWKYRENLLQTPGWISGRNPKKNTHNFRNEHNKKPRQQFCKQIRKNLCMKSERIIIKNCVINLHEGITGKNFGNNPLKDFGTHSVYISEQIP